MDWVGWFLEDRWAGAEGRLMDWWAGSLGVDGKAARGD